MALTEAQKILVLAFGLIGSLSIGLIIYNIKRKSNIRNSLAAKAANCILFGAMFYELLNGFIHCVFPYKCHHFFSGLSTGLGIKDDLSAMTGMALMTSVWGSTTIILGFAMMIPFLVDIDLFVTRFLLVVTLVVRSIEMTNLHTGILNDLSKNLPDYIIKGVYNSWENIRQAPPGKHLGVLRILLLVAGVFLSLIGQQKKVEEDKKSKKLQ